MAFRVALVVGFLDEKLVENLFQFFNFVRSRRFSRFIFFGHQSFIFCLFDLPPTAFGFFLIFFESLSNRMKDGVLLYSVYNYFFCLNVRCLFEFLGQLCEPADGLRNLLGEHPNDHRNQSKKENTAPQDKHNQVNLVLRLPCIELV